MKKNRLAAALVASLFAGSLLAASPAIAADIYVPDDTKGTEGESYPDGWFTGSPQPETAPVDDETGILLTGRAQLLHGGIIPIDSGETFAALASGAGVDTDDLVTFQYPVFFDSENGLGFSTLRPAEGNVGDADSWYSSWTVSIEGEVILAQGTHTSAEVLAAFDQAIELGAAPQVLAVGVFVDPDRQALVRSITFNGDTHYFTAEPVDEETETPEEPGTPEETETPEEAATPSTPGATGTPSAPVATPIATNATFAG